ncbi:MAG TPA: T9SS type A sorting domain-containing protein [Bacteroidia bacterium]|nr:T9SS type A sorting domain-containing protein [Bacteroidia bacterium]
MRRLQPQMLLIFLLFGEVSMHAQQFPSCNSSTISTDTTFHAYTTSTLSAANWADRLLLCGPYTTVIDTIRDSIYTAPERSIVFVGEFSKYTAKRIESVDFTVIFVKSTATLELKPEQTVTYPPIVILVEPGATVYDSSGFNHNIDTCSTLIFPSGSCANTGVPKGFQEGYSFNVMPVPANDYLRIVLERNSNQKEIKLKDGLGRLVKRELLNGMQNEIIWNINEIPDGFYTLELYDHDVKPRVEKVIKMKE